MRDSLKELIESKKEEFEIYDFSKEDSWDVIASKIKPESETKYWVSYWKYAVAACLMVVTGWFAYYLGQNKPVIDIHMSEWIEAENYYQYEINAKLSLVKTKVDDPILMADLESMGEAFEDLRIDLKDNVDNEEVVAAMLENYRLKLKILEKILEKINKDEKSKELPEVRL
ncbi:MAG: hypothetical protein ACJA08_001320 [Cyclobacteriaceae bacterium]|jgi:hypothetical protein